MKRGIRWTVILLLLCLLPVNALAAGGSITINHNNGGGISVVNATNVQGNMILTNSDETIGIVITPEEGYVIYGAYLNEVSMGIKNAKEPKTVYISPNGEDVVLRITFVKGDVASAVDEPKPEEPTNIPEEKPIDPEPIEEPMQQPEQKPEPPAQTEEKPPATQPPAPPTEAPRTPEVKPQVQETPTVVEEKDPVNEPHQEPKVHETESEIETEKKEAEVSGPTISVPPEQKENLVEIYGDGIGNVVSGQEEQKNRNWILAIGIAVAVVAASGGVLLYIKKDMGGRK